MRGIDNQPDLNDDKAYDIAQTFWNEVSSNANDEKDVEILYALH